MSLSLKTINWTLIAGLFVACWGTLVFAGFHTIAAALVTICGLIFWSYALVMFLVELPNSSEEPVKKSAAQKLTSFLLFVLSLFVVGWSTYALSLLWPALNEVAYFRLMTGQTNAWPEPMGKVWRTTMGPLAGALSSVTYMVATMKTLMLTRAGVNRLQRYCNSSASDAGNVYKIPRCNSN